MVDRDFFQDQAITDLKLTFEQGKLTRMTAASGLQPLQAFYDAADDGKDLFAYVDIGFNPKVRIPSGSRMTAWMPAGMVTVGVGNNAWAGGDNTVSFGKALHLAGSTLTVDGKVLVEAGTLKVPTM